MARTGLIIIGGASVDPAVVRFLPSDPLVIAADSGLDRARALGLTVDLLVGDLDSVSAGALAEAEAAGVDVRRHRPDKDATDTELALDLAVELGCDQIVVLSGGGRHDDSRLDHELGALLALAHPRFTDVRVEAYWGTGHLRVLHGPSSAEVSGSPGTIVSLIPVHGPATGIVTRGLRYPLTGETLGAGTTRGVSNELLAHQGTVHLDGGTLLVVIPLVLGGAP